MILAQSSAIFNSINGLSNPSRNTTSKLECVVQSHAAVGECPRWDEKRQRLWWVDILAPALHCFDPASGENLTFKLPEHTGCFVLTQDGGFLAAMRDGVWLLDAHCRPLRLARKILGRHHRRDSRQQRRGPVSPRWRVPECCEHRLAEFERPRLQPGWTMALSRRYPAFFDLPSSVR